MPTPLRPSRRSERMFSTYETEVYPLWGQPFADLILSAIEPRPHAQILEVGCAAGALSAELLRRFDGDSRIVALETSPVLQELARERLGDAHAGRRIHLRDWAARGRLPSADAAFDLVVANLALVDAPDPRALLADLVRVARPGAQLVVAAALRGTWREPLDLLREVLTKRRLEDARRALEDYTRGFLEPGEITRALVAAGLGPVGAHLEQGELVFRSAREFFFAPVIELGPLPRWKQACGRGEAMQETFFSLKQSIETYFAGQAFAVSVLRGRFVGRKIGANAGGAAA